MSWRGIFLDPIDSNIQARLNARQYQLSKGTHKGIRPIVTLLKT